MLTDFNKGYPYPHVIIDNFTNSDLLTNVETEFDNFDYWGYDATFPDRQVNKYFYPWGNEPHISPTHFRNNTKTLTDLLISEEFLLNLTELTGIENLIADKDFNQHPTTGLHRRLNLLLYLNKNWNDDWGGELEMWNHDITECVHKIQPIFNRVVIFSTIPGSYHGHPKPLTCPYHRKRRAISCYYFTEERPEDEKTAHTNYLEWYDTPDEY